LNAGSLKKSKTINEEVDETDGISEGVDRCHGIEKSQGNDMSCTLKDNTE